MPGEYIKTLLPEYKNPESRPGWGKTAKATATSIAKAAAAAVNTKQCLSWKEGNRDSVGADTSGDCG